MKLDATHTYDFEDELYVAKYVPVHREGDTITLKSQGHQSDDNLMPTIIVRIVPSTKQPDALWFDVDIQFPDLLSKDMEYYDSYAYWINQWGYAAGAAEVLSKAVVHPDSYYED